MQKFVDFQEEFQSTVKERKCGNPETSARLRKRWKLHFNFNCNILLNILVERPTEQIVGHLSLNKEELQLTHIQFT